MSKAKKNKVFGLLSVISKNSSWNSDFNHSPKQYDEQFFASDRSLKFAVRNLMEQMGKEVFIKKWVDGYSIAKNKKSTQNILKTADIKKHIKSKFGVEFHQAFWNFEDIKQFGFVYDGINLTGVTQISQGLDKYGKGTIYEDDLTGRMEFESKSDASKTTKGMNSREFLSEAHYLYDFSVNPKNVKFLQDVKGYEKFTYTEDDFQLLLECLQNGPANIRTTQKMNCFTGFMAYVEMKDGEHTLLSNLQGKVFLEEEKQDGKVIYNIEQLVSYLEKKQKNANTTIYKKINITYDENEMIIKGLDTLKTGSLSKMVEITEN